MPKLKKTEKKITPMFSEKDIAKMAEEYSEISAQIKELSERKSMLSDKIKQGAESFGVKDDKGSYYLESDRFIMGKVASKSFSINQDKAVKVLESMGLGDVVDVVIVKTVNDKKLESAVLDKRISLDEVNKFTNTSITYKVSVKPKEEMAEVEQSTLKVAKRK